jgi:thiamine biosynthesis lipoprotein
MPRRRAARSPGGEGDGWHPDEAKHSRPFPFQSFASIFVSAGGARRVRPRAAAAGSQPGRHGHHLHGGPLRRGPGPLEAAADEAFAEVRRLDSLLSNYRPNSEWSRVNREAAERPVRVSDELFELLAACLDYSRASEGAFDITVGPLMKTWGFYKGTGRLACARGGEGRAGPGGLSNIVLDPNSADGPLRPAGRGAGSGRHRQGLRGGPHGGDPAEHGIRSALVSASGSSIYGLGAPPERAGVGKCASAIRSDETTTVETLRLKDCRFPLRAATRSSSWPGARPTPTSWIRGTGFPATGDALGVGLAPRRWTSEAWTKPFFIPRPPVGGPAQTQGLARLLCEDTAELHARGSHEQSLSGCLPSPADRRTAGVVHAAGRSLPEALSGHPGQARLAGDLQAARAGGHGDLAAGGDIWTWTRPSFSPTCCCRSSRWA